MGANFSNMPLHLAIDFPDLFQFTPHSLLLSVNLRVVCFATFYTVVASRFSVVDLIALQAPVDGSPAILSHQI